MFPFCAWQEDSSPKPVTESNFFLLRPVLGSVGYCARSLLCAFSCPLPTHLGQHLRSTETQSSQVHPQAHGSPREVPQTPALPSPVGVALCFHTGCLSIPASGSETTCVPSLSYFRFCGFGCLQSAEMQKFHVWEKKWDQGLEGISAPMCSLWHYPQ